MSWWWFALLIPLSVTGVLGLLMFGNRKSKSPVRPNLSTPPIVTPPASPAVPQGTTPAPHGDGETGGGHAHSDKRSMWWYVLFLFIGYFLVIDVVKIVNWHSAAQVKQAQSQLVNAKFAEDPSNWIWSFQCVDAPGDPIRGDIGEARIFERGLSRDDKGITYLRFWHISGGTGNQVIYVWHRGQGGTYNDGRRDFSFTLDPSSNEQCLSGTLEDLDDGVLKRHNWLMKPLRFIPPKPRP